MKRFKAMSRCRAENPRCTEPYAMISFGKPGQKPPDLEDDPMRKAFLRLECHDIHTEAASYTLFSDVDAERILSFAEKAREEELGLMVIHCEAGISRSDGCKEALSEIHGYDDSRERRHGANPWIKARILAAHDGRRPG